MKVKVSFGKGNIARIPWIAFLREGQTVQKGIYPVYLYYKSKDLLVLAYCVSETNKPLINWNLSNSKSIDQFFLEKNYGKPDRYGKSFVFKTYDTTKKLDKDEIDKDLIEILHFYKSISFKTEKVSTPPRLVNNNENNSTVMKSKYKNEIFNYLEFYNKCIYANFFISKKHVLRFTASLLTKPFVILTGLSGSGKTKLAQAFVLWICENDDQYRLIPVGADWTNREPLLGYPNALNPDEYVKPESGVLDMIEEASKIENQNKPFFLILDEMNLSHVERYFADFLSVMESKEAIPLHADEKVKNGVPANLYIPSNLFIIGTVNIDETTNMFSPKVLDRANTIEFRVTEKEMEDFLEAIQILKMDNLKNAGAGMAKSFLELSKNELLITKDEEINKTLIRFFNELKKTGAEFGYRSATEILKLIHNMSILDGKLSINEKLDIAIMQKLLPKLHGSRRKLCPILATLGTFCLSGEIKIEKEVFEKVDFDFNDSSVLYPLSLEKITRMYKGAIDNGFTSFAEA